MELLTNNAINRCTFRGNQAAINGGGMHAIHTLVVDSHIHPCKALSAQMATRITDSFFTANVAGSKGGGLYVGILASLDLNTSNFTMNTAGIYGGGMAWESLSTTALVMANSRFTGMFE